MRSDYTHITAILDSSGSMESIRESTIGGFNVFLRGQKSAPGKATFTQIQFSSGIRLPRNVPGWPPIGGGISIGGGHAAGAIFGGVLNNGKPRYEDTYQVPSYYVVDDRVDIQQVKELTVDTFVPYGGTPLLDTIGRAIEETGKWLASLPEHERPSKVLFVTVTDGNELTSQVYTYATLSKLIELQTNVYNWAFMYLGANQDAIAAASKIGIKSSLAASYGTGSLAVGATYDLMTNKAAVYRSAVSASVGASAMAFTDEERTTAMTGEVPPTA